MLRPITTGLSLLLVSTPVLPAQDEAKPAAAGKKMCGGRVELARIFRELLERHDKDRDGRITAAEFTRGKAQFDNHDRNRDGVITAADYPVDRFWNGFGPGFARSADRDRDGVVSGEEWRRMLAMLDPDGDGTISMEEFGRMAPPHVTSKPKLVALSFDQNGNGVIDRDDFASLFSDLDLDRDGALSAAELRGNQRLWTGSRGKLPKVGETAPDFTLARSDLPKQTVRLSAHAGERPVALIFGSYT